MLSRRFPLALCALVWLLASLPAVADEMPLDPNDNPEVHTYDSTIDAPLGPHACGVSGSFTLPQFDDTILIPVPGFGMQPRELVSVYVSVTASIIDGYNAWENEDNIDANAMVQIGARLRVQSVTPSAPLVVVTFPVDSNTGTLKADSDGDPPDYSGDDTIAAIADGDSDANDATIDVSGPENAAKRAEWSGTGDIAWNFDPNSHFSADIRPAVQPDNLFESPKVHFTAEVRYLWQVAPEPATLAMLAMGSAGLLVRRTRRRRK